MEETVQQQKSKPGPKRVRPDETKVPLGLRCYHSDRVEIERRYNKSMQEFFDIMVEKELSTEPSGNVQD